MELIVRGSRYFTVGDNGAQFFPVKKGDVIFNAEQTKELFEKGKITSAKKRGTALAEGTAYRSSYVDYGDSGTGSGAFHDKPSGGSGSKKPSKGSSSSKKKEKEKDEKEKIDWIEVLLDRIERAIDRLARIADSAFKKLGTRLSATADEIAKVTQEISYQQQGSARYLQEAESVKLDESIKQLVRDGKIDIKEYDKDTAELISEYQEWYEKALDCQDAVEELKETLAELYESRFDMMQTDFENQLSLLEHLSTTYENGLDDIEERGYLGGAQYYEALKSVEQQNIGIMQQELADLTQAMNDAVNSGYIEKYSESWYGMQDEINGVKESIQEAEMAIVEYNNAIREMNWEIFDYMQERISKVADEAGFLIDLMSNDKLYEDNGQLTNEGMATMGLHGANYNTYMEQADRYAEELLELDRELANDPYNTKLIERREELLEAQQESIQNAESEKDEIKSLVEDGIQKEIDHLNELIDKRKEALSQQQEAYSFQRKMLEQTKAVSDLEKQMAAYEGDTSEENRARVQQLKVSLEEANADLEESLYDKYVSDQEELLDNLVEEYQDVLNRRLDDIDLLIADMIDRINANATSIEDTLYAVTDEVGYTMSETMRDIWDGSDSLKGIITNYGDNFLNSMTSLNEALGRIEAYVGNMVTAGDETASEVVESTPPPSSPQPQPQQQPQQQKPSQQKPQSGSQYDIRVVKGKEYVSFEPEFDAQHYPIEVKFPVYASPDENSKKVDEAVSGELWGYMGERDGWYYVAPTESGRHEGWVKMEGTQACGTDEHGRILPLKQLRGFSKGGIIGDPKKIAGKNGDNIVTINTLKKGEAILTPDQTKMFARFVDYLPQAQEAMNAQRFMSKVPDSRGNGGVTIGDVSFNIPIDHVEDYDDLVTKMQKDTQFEKLIQSMTVDRLAGKSPLAKHKYKWG